MNSGVFENAAAAVAGATVVEGLKSWMQADSEKARQRFAAYSASELRPMMREMLQRRDWPYQLGCLLDKHPEEDKAREMIRRGIYQATNGVGAMGAAEEIKQELRKNFPHFPIYKPSVQSYAELGPSGNDYVQGFVKQGRGPQEIADLFVFGREADKIDLVVKEFPDSKEEINKGIATGLQRSLDDGKVFRFANAILVIANKNDPSGSIAALPAGLLVEGLRRAEMRDEPAGRFLPELREVLSARQDFAEIQEQVRQSSVAQSRKTGFFQKLFGGPAPV